MCVEGVVCVCVCGGCGVCVCVEGVVCVGVEGVCVECVCRG